MRVFCTSIEQSAAVLSRALAFVCAVQVTNCSGTDEGYWVEFDPACACNEEDVAHIVGDATLDPEPASA